MKTIDIEQIKKDIGEKYKDYEILWVLANEQAPTIIIGILSKEINNYLFDYLDSDEFYKNDKYYITKNAQAILNFYPDDDCVWVNPRYKDLYDKYSIDAEAEHFEAVFLRACGLKKVTAPSEEEFRLNLSKLEQEALSKIKEKFIDSGNISVVKLIQETNISRPIWTSLMNKMKEHGFAKVENQGVKGTYIKFL